MMASAAFLKLDPEVRVGNNDLMAFLTSREFWVTRGREPLKIYRVFLSGGFLHRFQLLVEIEESA
jgi:hypothetical protein